MTINAVCSFCRKPKPQDFCEACYTPLCTSCVNHFNPNQFELSEEPCTLDQTRFCHHCYEEKAVPLITEYENLLAVAKEIHFWPKSYHGHIPVIKKANFKITVENIRDEKEALLRLGFKAAKLGFNSIVQGEIHYKKERNHAYQKMMWNGVATPANVDLEKVERIEFRDEIYGF